MHNKQVAAPIQPHIALTMPAPITIHKFVTDMLGSALYATQTTDNLTPKDLRKSELPPRELEEKIVDWLTQNGVTIPTTYTGTASLRDATPATAVRMAWTAPAPGETNTDDGPDTGQLIDVQLPTPGTMCPSVHPGSPSTIGQVINVLSAGVNIAEVVPEGILDAVFGLFTPGIPFKQVPRTATKAATDNAGTDPAAQALHKHGQQAYLNLMQILAIASVVYSAGNDAVEKCIEDVKRVCTENDNDDGAPFLACARDYVQDTPFFECFSPNRQVEFNKFADPILYTALIGAFLYKLAQVINVVKPDNSLEGVLKHKLGDTHPLIPLVLNELAQTPKADGIPTKVIGAASWVMDLPNKAVKAVEARVWAGKHDQLLFDSHEYPHAGNTHVQVTSKEMATANTIYQRLQTQATPSDSRIRNYVSSVGHFVAQFSPVSLETANGFQVQCETLLAIAEKAGPDKREQVLTLLEKLALYGDLVTSKAAMNALGNYTKTTLVQVTSTQKARAVIAKMITGDYDRDINLDKLTNWQLHQLNGARQAAARLIHIHDTVKRAFTAECLEGDMEAQHEKSTDKIFHSTEKLVLIKTQLEILGIEHSIIGAAGKLVGNVRQFVGALSFFFGDYISFGKNVPEFVTPVLALAIQK